MAPKKSNPMEEPPAASSSEEEEEEDNSSEEVTSSDEEGEEDTQEPSSPPPQQTQKQSAVKKPETAPATPQGKSTSSEDSESDSESDSETDATPKPIATKPMEETPKVTKPRSKPASKRPSETDEAAKDSKRAKTKGLEADPEEDKQKKPGEDTRKQLFQRLWSEDDEIAILKGMIEYSAKHGLDPNQDTQAFYDYIKKSLHVDVSKSQVVDKIRRLKKKFENNLGRGLKKGEDRTFSKPHEQEAYDLSKKLWGSESTGRVTESAAKSNGKAKKNQNQKGNNKLLAAMKAELVDGAKGDMMDVSNDKKGNSVVTSASLKEKEKVLFDKSLGVSGLEEFVINDGLDIIGGAKKGELEERWKKLQVAQLELFMQRNELIKEQAKLILDALKSSSD